MVMLVMMMMLQNVHLVMELCEGGELFDRIKAHKFYPEPKAAAVCRTVTEVLKYCHSGRDKARGQGGWG